MTNRLRSWLSLEDLPPGTTAGGSIKAELARAAAFEEHLRKGRRRGTPLRR